jgi:hypothetical protein
MKPIPSKPTDHEGAALPRAAGPPFLKVFNPTGVEAAIISEVNDLIHGESLRQQMTEDRLLELTNALVLAQRERDQLRQQRDELIRLLAEAEERLAHAADHAGRSPIEPPSCTAVFPDLPASPLPTALPPLIATAHKAFHRDLPGLLSGHRGQWVAYHGDEQIGIDDDDEPLIRECQRRGLNAYEYIVDVIEPKPAEPEAVDLPSSWR